AGTCDRNGGPNDAGPCKVALRGVDRRGLLHPEWLRHVLSMGESRTAAFPEGGPGRRLAHYARPFAQRIRARHRSVDGRIVDEQERTALVGDPDGLTSGSSRGKSGSTGKG